MISINIISFFVLNLIITGMPSILWTKRNFKSKQHKVLNLIITGMPSIPDVPKELQRILRGFKPYYNWNAFNTLDFSRVLNSWLFSSFFNPRNIWPKSRNLSTFSFFVLNIYYFFLKKTQKITNFSFNTNRKVKC